MTTALPDTCPHCEMNLVPYHDEARPLRFCVHCHFPLLEIAGKYRLMDVLGKGGFGTVYRAKHTQIKRDPDRVIKVLKADLIDKPGMKPRFFREVQLTSTLSQHNPHIVRVYDDFGEIPDLGYFYVMEFLRGLPLTHYLHPPSPAPPFDWCLEVFAQLCDAMHAAHNEGIIHRDIKPDNVILISYRGRDNFVKVLDFGIAKPLIGETLQSGSLEVATKGILGTPFYIAPEQAMNRHIGPHTDIYSMAIILHEMLTGELPLITPKQRKEMTLVQILRMRLEIEQIPPPSQVYPHKQLPLAFDAIFQKALHRDPNQRYQSAEEFWNAVAPFYNGHAPAPAFSPNPIGEPDAPPFALTKPQEHAIEGKPTVVSAPSFSASTFDPYATVLESNTAHIPEQEMLAPQDSDALLAHASTVDAGNIDPEEFQKTTPAAVPTPIREHTFLGEARPLPKRRHSKWIAPFSFFCLMLLGAALAYYLKTKELDTAGSPPPPPTQPKQPIYNRVVHPPAELPDNAPRKRPHKRRYLRRHRPKPRPVKRSSHRGSAQLPKRTPPVKRVVAPLRRHVITPPKTPVTAPPPRPPKACKSNQRFLQIANFQTDSININLYPSAPHTLREDGVCIPIKTHQIIIEQSGYDTCQITLQPSRKSIKLYLREYSDPNDLMYCLRRR
ncbi:MAG: protein kinase [Myxococcales bacterium]|nr:protein kinase [Myxococcales bacterium]